MDTLPHYRSLDRVTSTEYYFKDAPSATKNSHKTARTKQILAMADPTPLPNPRPSRPPNADIAVDEDAPPSPTPVGSPSRRLYSEDGVGDDKRSHPTNRFLADDGLSSPPKKGVRRSPHRCIQRPHSVGAPPIAPLYDLFTETEDRPSPTTVCISPEQARKLQSVISAMKTRPLSARRAILPIRRKPKKTAKSKTAKAKPTQAKAGRPKSNKRAGSRS